MSCHTDGNCCGAGSYCCANNAPHSHDDGEDAIRREVAACEAEELERTELAQAAFRAKLAYWREHGAPGYHGPRAGRD